jgi:predicted ATPase
LNLFSWWHQRRSARSAGMAMFKRGLAEGHQHDDTSAMAHYTSAIDMADAPQDIRAMALYNRALLHVACKNFVSAAKDLNAVLDLPAPLRQIKSAARQKLDRMQHAQGSATA